MKTYKRLTSIELLVCTILSLAMSSDPAYAYPVNVGGIVRLCKGTNHAGIRVTFSGLSSTATDDSALTDSLGRYSRTVERGVYRISFSMPGFIPGRLGDTLISASGVVLRDFVLDTVGTPLPSSGTLSRNVVYVLDRLVNITRFATLTIPPGTKIYATNSGTLTSEGTVIADGGPGPADSIVFTSINGYYRIPGTGMTGEWGGIGSKFGSFSRVVVEYATTGLNTVYTTVKNCSVHDAVVGILLNGGNSVVKTNIVSRCGIGVKAVSGVGQIFDNVISDCLDWGIVASDGVSLINSNRIRACPFGILSYGEARKPLIRDNVITELTGLSGYFQKNQGWFTIPPLGGIGILIGSKADVVGNLIDGASTFGVSFVGNGEGVIDSNRIQNQLLPNSSAISIWRGVIVMRNRIFNVVGTGVVVNSFWGGDFKIWGNIFRNAAAGQWRANGPSISTGPWNGGTLSIKHNTAYRPDVFLSIAGPTSSVDVGSNIVAFSRKFLYREASAGSSLRISCNDIFRPSTLSDFGAFLPNYAGNFSQTIYGDTIDSYGNFSVDPDFVDTSGYNFLLKVSSHCIDTGDPRDPRDPDGSISDVGATYFNHTLVSPVSRMALESFMVERVGPCSILAKWNVSDAEGVYGYLVERRVKSDREFYPVARFVRARDRVSVEQVDSNVIEGGWTYRLRELFLDGSTAVSTEHEIGVGSVLDADNPAISREFRLDQNYPNPFNNSTTIAFSLSAVSRVSVEIFDVTGRSSTLLSDEMRQPGMNEVSFDASSFSSGVYYYRLIAVPVDGAAKSLVAVRKMMLLK